MLSAATARAPQGLHNAGHNNHNYLHPPTETLRGDGESIAEIAVFDDSEIEDSESAVFSTATETEISVVEDIDVLPSDLDAYSDGFNSPLSSPGIAYNGVPFNGGAPSTQANFVQGGNSTRPLAANVNTSLAPTVVGPAETSPGADFFSRDSFIEDTGEPIEQLIRKKYGENITVAAEKIAEKRRSIDPNWDHTKNIRRESWEARRRSRDVEIENLRRSWMLNAEENTSLGDLVRKKYGETLAIAERVADKRKSLELTGGRRSFEKRRSRDVDMQSRRRSRSLAAAEGGRVRQAVDKLQMPIEKQTSTKARQQDETGQEEDDDSPVTPTQASTGFSFPNIPQNNPTTTSSDDKRQDRYPPPQSHPGYHLTIPGLNAHQPVLIDPKDGPPLSAAGVPHDTRSEFENQRASSIMTDNHMLHAASPLSELMDDTFGRQPDATNTNPRPRLLDDDGRPIFWAKEAYANSPSLAEQYTDSEFASNYDARNSPRPSSSELRSADVLSESADTMHVPGTPDAAKPSAALVSNAPQQEPLSNTRNADKPTHKLSDDTLKDRARQMAEDLMADLLSADQSGTDIMSTTSITPSSPPRQPKSNLRRFSPPRPLINTRGNSPPRPKRAGQSSNTEHSNIEIHVTAPPKTRSRSSTNENLPSNRSSESFHLPPLSIFDQISTGYDLPTMDRRKMSFLQQAFTEIEVESRPSSVVEPPSPYLATKVAAVAAAAREMAAKSDLPRPMSPDSLATTSPGPASSQYSPNLTYLGPSSPPASPPASAGMDTRYQQPQEIPYYGHQRPISPPATSQYQQHSENVQTHQQLQQHRHLSPQLTPPPMSQPDGKYIPQYDATSSQQSPSLTDRSHDKPSPTHPTEYSHDTPAKNGMGSPMMNTNNNPYSPSASPVPSNGMQSPVSPMTYPIPPMPVPNSTDVARSMFNSAIYSGYLWKENRHGMFQKRLVRFDGLLLICLSPKRIRLPDNLTLPDFDPFHYTSSPNPPLPTEFIRAIEKCYPIATPLTTTLTNPLIAAPVNSKSGGDGDESSGGANPDVAGKYYLAPKWVIPSASILQVRAIVQQPPKEPESRRARTFIVRTAERDYVFRAPSARDYTRWTFLLSRMSAVGGDGADDSGAFQDGGDGEATADMDQTTDAALTEDDDDDDRDTQSRPMSPGSPGGKRSTSQPRSPMSPIARMASSGDRLYAAMNRMESFRSHVNELTTQDPQIREAVVTVSTTSPNTLERAVYAATGGGGQRSGAPSSANSSRTGSMRSTVERRPSLRGKGKREESPPPPLPTSNMMGVSLNGHIVPAVGTEGGYAVAGDDSTRLPHSPELSPPSEAAIAAAISVPFERTTIERTPLPPEARDSPVPPVPPLPKVDNILNAIKQKQQQQEENTGDYAETAIDDTRDERPFHDQTGPGLIQQILGGQQAESLPDVNQQTPPPPPPPPKSSQSPISPKQAMLDPSRTLPKANIPQRRSSKKGASSKLKSTVPPSPPVTTATEPEKEKGGLRRKNSNKSKSGVKRQNSMSKSTKEKEGPPVPTKDQSKPPKGSKVNSSIQNTPQSGSQRGADTAVSANSNGNASWTGLPLRKSPSVKSNESNAGKTALNAMEALEKELLQYGSTASNNTRGAPPTHSKPATQKDATEEALSTRKPTPSTIKAAMGISKPVPLDTKQIHDQYLRVATPASSSPGKLPSAGEAGSFSISYYASSPVATASLLDIAFEKSSHRLSVISDAGTVLPGPTPSFSGSEFLIPGWGVQRAGSSMSTDTAGNIFAAYGYSGNDGASVLEGPPSPKYDQQQTTGYMSPYGPSKLGQQQGDTFPSSQQRQKQNAVPAPPSPPRFDVLAAHRDLSATWSATYPDLIHSCDGIARVLRRLQGVDVEGPYGKKAVYPTLAFFRRFAQTSIPFFLERIKQYLEGYVSDLDKVLSTAMSMNGVLSQPELVKIREALEGLRNALAIIGLMQREWEVNVIAPLTAKVVGKDQMGKGGNAGSAEYNRIKRIIAAENGIGTDMVDAVEKIKASVDSLMSA
ncbi:hypothetical protein HK102_004035 [Quaeritorhiza haematococci]|nr:hypothetical protein HK102_004035 [Quaeritorhiza haematococci]